MMMTKTMTRKDVLTYIAPKKLSQLKGHTLPVT